MNIVFFGNSKYSVIGAETIQKTLPLSLVVTNPKSFIETFAREKNIPVLTTNKLTDKIIEKIQQANPDFFVVEDYGLILPNRLLAFPKIAALNIHHSLLPKYRGSTPAPSALLAGEKESGVTIIKMTENVDAGDILAQEKIILQSDETTDSLLTTLNKIGGEIILPVLKNFSTMIPQKQNEGEATFTKQLTKQSGFVNSEHPPAKEQLDRMIRAYYPWPSVWTKTRIKNYELRIKFLPEKKIQVEGKKPMSYKDFVNGYEEGKNILTSLGLL